MKVSFAPVLAATFMLLSIPVQATFSIIACDRETGACGAAVATHNLAVGASVPTIIAGVGAVVSQFETNPHHGGFILSELRKKVSVNEILAAVLAKTEPFEGLGADWRQIGVVSHVGEATAHTGTVVKEQTFAGHIVKTGVTVQGNGLANEAVLTRALETFEAAEGALAMRLLRALEAAEQAGGQSIGLKSAALVVRTPDGWPVDIDLRVDSSMKPIKDLKAAFNEHMARIMVNRAERKVRSGDLDTAFQLLERAVELAPYWDRIARSSALLAHSAGNTGLARDYAARFQDLNPVWSRSWCGDPELAELIQCD